MGIYKGKASVSVFLSVIILSLFMHGCIQGPPPAQAVNDLILALEKNGEPSAGTLSLRDRSLFERLYGPKMIKEIHSGSGGENAYEAYVLRYFLQNPGRWPGQAPTAARGKYRVTGEWIRGNYAEVDIFIPGLRSYLKPLQRIILLKEGGRWNIAPVATGMMSYMAQMNVAVMKKGLPSSFTTGDFYDFCLEYFGFSLSLDSSVRQRELEMPKDWRDSFNKQLDLNPGIKWLLSKNGRGFSHQRTAGENPFKTLPLEQKFRILEMRPIGKVLLPAFLKKYKQNPAIKSLKPKAHYVMAGQWHEDREFERAVKEYKACISTGVPGSEMVIRAKTQLALIYWHSLKQLKKARPYIDELRTLNRLPKSLDIPQLTMSPEVIASEADPGYDQGIADFDLHPSGKWVDVLYHWCKGGIRGLANRMEVIRFTMPGTKSKTIAKIDARLSKSKEFRKEKVVDRYDQMAWTQDGLWLYNTDRTAYVLKLNEKGKRLERRRDEGEHLTLLSKSGDVALLPWRTSSYESIHHMNWDDADFSGSSLFVLAFPRAVKIFDLESFSLKSKIILKSRLEQELTLARICAAGNGTFAGVSRRYAGAYQFGADGRMLRQFRDIPYEPSLERVHDLECGPDGSLYVLLSEDRTIAVYSTKGRLLRVLDIPAWDKSIMALDPSGNIYLSGRKRIFIYNSSGFKKTSFDIMDPPGRVDNSSIVDLVAPGDGYIYLRVGRYVQRYDYYGKRLDYWKMKNLKEPTGRGRELVTGPGKQVYVRLGLDFYHYKGEHTSHWLTLPLKPNAGNLSGDRVTWTRIDKNNVIYGYSYAMPTGYFNYHHGSRMLVKKFAGFKDAESYRVAMDCEGHFWFKSSWLSRKEEDRYSIIRYGPRGRRLVRIRNKPAARRKWLPSDIVVDDQGYFVIADSINRRLVRFDPDGNYEGEADLKPISSGGISRIRVDKHQNYYVLFRGKGQALIRFSGISFKKKDSIKTTRPQGGRR